MRTARRGSLTTKDTKDTKKQSGPCRFEPLCPWCPLWLVVVMMLGMAHAAETAPARRPGAPPKVLNVVRQTLKRGAVSAYATLEATIVRGYQRARIPLYWIALQSAKSPVEILYLNLFDAADGAARAEATYRDTVPRHPDLVRLQERLAAHGAAPPTSTLTMRRDEFVYGRDDVDFATMAALRVTVFHVKAGHEGEFVDAAQTGRAVPWQMYEDTATSTFFLVAPLGGPSDRRATATPRTLRRLKGIYTVERPVVYVVQPAMSHAPPEFAAVNARYRKATH